MNKSILTVGIIFLGIIALLLLQVLNNYSTGSELDYYLLKETTDAAIEDSLDKIFYSDCGVYRIDKEKFVENFIYRFANSVDASRTYKIGFYDINEAPPKVSIKVDSLTSVSFGSVDKDGNKKQEAANITTRYDAIVESEYKTDVLTEMNMKNPDSDQCKNVYKKTS